MTSSYHPQQIPPFKGGPLQATDVQNRRVDAQAAYSKKVTAVSGRSTGTENVRSGAPSQRTGAAYPAVERRQPTARQEPSERSKPPSRLEREKKRNHNDPKNIGPWKLEKLIGQGASGRVRLATHLSTGQQAAVKIIPRTLINQSRMSLRDADAKANKMILGIEREIVIMKLIEHPNLLGLWDVYETSKDLFLIMEYVAGGELFDHLVAQGRLQPREARNYFRQIIFGMDYCHRFNICHRDLKPENLLLDETKTIVKVADFGMAALQPTEKMLETSCGSPHYASPEIVSGKRYKGTASDIWSCGIILFALLCGRLPFDDPNIQQLLGKVRAGKFIMPEWLEPASKDLIWRMLEVDPEKRITMYEIMRHPWFTNNGLESNRNPVTTSFDNVMIEDLSPESIDLDILGNLKTLWSELSEEDIVRQLLSNGPNWQKTFYTLLVTHRENHSADDDEDFEEDKAPIVDQSAFLTASNALNYANEKARPRPRRSLDAIGSAPPSPRSAEQELRTVELSSPVRPKAPSRPGSSMGTHRPPSRGTSDASRSPAPTTRPLPSPTKVVPQIKLQGSTPSKDDAVGASLQRRATSPSKQGQTAKTVVTDENGQVTPVRPRVARAAASDITPKPGPRASSRPVSPIKPGQTSQLRPTVASTAPPMIHVPQVGDATVQKFFQEIADELASIRATGEKPDALQSKLDRLRDSVATNGSVRGHSTPAPQTHPADNVASPAMTNYSDLTQFEDAEDDVSEGESLQSDAPYTPKTPLTPLSPPLKTAPLAFTDKGPLTHPGRQNVSTDAASVTSTGRSVRSTRQAASVGTNSRPASIFSSGSGNGSVLSRKRSLLGRNKDKHADEVQLDGRNAIAYEQTRPGATPSTGSGTRAGLTGFSSPQKTGPTRLQQRKNPGLGLDIGTASNVSPNPLSPGASSVTSSAPPTPSMTTSPKNSWFAGLFNWKPATFTLMSTENFSETLLECKRLLQSYGVRVLVEDSEHHSTLKCTVSEYREVNGAVTTAKPVRFRVEFTILPVGSAANSPHLGLGLALHSPGPQPSPVLSTFSRNSAASSGVSSADYAKRSSVGFATSMTLIQEKGALSTFKLVHSRLRREWMLDQTPISSAVI